MLKKRTDEELFSFAIRATEMLMTCRLDDVPTQTLIELSEFFNYMEEKIQASVQLLSDQERIMCVDRAEEVFKWKALIVDAESACQSDECQQLQRPYLTKDGHQIPLIDGHWDAIMLLVNAYDAEFKVTKESPFKNVRERFLNGERVPSEFFRLRREVASQFTKTCIGRRKIDQRKALSQLTKREAVTTRPPFAPNCLHAGKKAECEIESKGK